MVMMPENASELRVLDVACGEGVFGESLKEKFHGKCYVHGIDISENALKHAGRFYDATSQLNIEYANLQDYLKGDRFDYIVCLEVLEHLFNPTAVLENVKTFLKEGGYLITSFPNIAWWKYRLDLLKGDFPRGYTLFGPEEHIQNFTLSSFKELLKATDFELVEINTHYSFPKLLRPVRKCLIKYVSLFGYQIVIKAKDSVQHRDG